MAVLLDSCKSLGFRQLTGPHISSLKWRWAPFGGAQGAPEDFLALLSQECQQNQKHVWRRGLTARVRNSAGATAVFRTHAGRIVGTVVSRAEALLLTVPTIL